jgi:hypothetical protein
MQLNPARLNLMLAKSEEEKLELEEYNNWKEKTESSLVTK